MNPTDQRHDAALLLARILLVVLFIVAGYGKLMNFAGATAYMASDGLPMPDLAAGLAVAVELGLGLVLLAGAFTRPLALLMAAYTLLTGFLGHHFWTLDGPARAANLIHFDKNLAITGGFLLLALTGPGRFSIDHLKRK